MEIILNKIEEILKSDIMINLDGSIMDDRFKQIHMIVNSFNYKDNIFYTELIRLISRYYSKIYNNKKVIGDELLDMAINTRNIVTSKELFDYICYILRFNQNIKLDNEILFNLFDNNPKKKIDYHVLAKYLKRNNVLNEIEFTLDNIYELLIKTNQIKEISFIFLVSSEEFKNNHVKIDNYLLSCDDFSDIIYIIINYLDNNYDWLTILKNPKSKINIEKVIYDFIKNSCFKEVHTILNSEYFNIDYNYQIGNTTLKDFIALSNNSLIITDLLSNSKNSKKNYSIDNYFDKNRVYKLRKKENL